MAGILNAPMKGDPTPDWVRQKRKSLFKGVHVFVSGSTWDWFRPIYPGDTIRDSMLRMQVYPATYRARTAVIDAPLAIAGRTARRMLLPGEPVPVNAVDDPRLVSRGAPTTLVFEENGLVITTLGAPLQNGGLGETIRVRNIDTNRIVVGTVMPDGRIRIGAQ